MDIKDLNLAFLKAKLDMFRYMEQIFALGYWIHADGTLQPVAEMDDETLCDLYAHVPTPEHPLYAALSDEMKARGL